jgi:hypothetical protein
MHKQSQNFPTTATTTKGWLETGGAGASQMVTLAKSSTPMPAPELALVAFSLPARKSTAQADTSQSTSTHPLSHCMPPACPPTNLPPTHRLPRARPPRWTPQVTVHQQVGPRRHLPWHGPRVKAAAARNPAHCRQRGALAARQVIWHGR